MALGSIAYVARGLVLASALCAGAGADKPLLLTANGVGNPKYSEYKKAPIANLAGAGYYAVPAMRGEESSPEKRVPFAKGTMTNGDSTTAWKRKPGPYTYWTRKPRGELVFELGVPCRIRKVRVSLLVAGTTGCGRVWLYDRGNPLEFPEALLMGDIRAPKPGWNEFTELDRLTDGLKLVFELGKGKTYLTVREVEIWGTPMPRQDDAKPVSTPSLLAREGARWYAFDFGTKGSPVMPGLTGVCKDSAYQAQAGYGWLAPGGEIGEHLDDSNFTPPSTVVPGLNDRDRCAGKRGMVIDLVNRDFVAAMGYYHTQTRHAFAVDVPNGRYRAVTFHSDVAYGHVGIQRFTIDAEGQRVVENPYFEGISGRREFDVAVADGQLVLVLDGTDPDVSKRGWHINGLLVLPVNSAKERAFAEKQIQRVLELLDRERKEAFKRTFVQKPHVEKNPMPPVSAPDRGRGFVAFVPNWMEMVYPNTVPTAESLKRRLHAFACRQEREPYAVAVRALEPARQMRLTVSDLRGPSVIPAAAFDVRTVRYHPQRIGSSWSREWCIMPQILDPHRPVDLAADRTQEFWLTVTVPADARPGTYTGKATLTCDRGKAELPLSLEVLPFDLADSGKWVGMYWRPFRCDTRQRMLKQIDDMRAHGMNCVAATPPKPKMDLVNDTLEVDARETLDFLRLLKSKGLGGPIACHWGTERWAKKLFGAKRLREGVRRIAAELVKISERPDTPELLFYPVDEIGNHPKRETDFMRKAELIKQVPGAKVYCTVNKFAAGKRCARFIDYWCSNIVFTPEWEAFVHQQKKVYMRYGSHYTKNPRKARNSSGFGFYRRNAVAMYYWHYQAVVGDPCDDLDGGSRDWCAAYPGREGPIPTLDWEGVGEGVDDLRYVNTLKALAARCHGLGGDAAAQAKRALAALDKMLAADTTTSAYDFMQKLSDDAFHAMRREVVNLTLPLHAALSGR